MVGFKNGRKRKRLTQQEAARRLRVTQPYLSMVERGERTPSVSLARKLARLYRAPWLLPTVAVGPADPDDLANELASLGYPGFAYLTRGSKVRPRYSPAAVLMSALLRDDLESRLAEALPWLLLRYPELDKKWLVSEAKNNNVQNKLGFVVSLARSVLSPGDSRLLVLNELDVSLRDARLAQQQTFGARSLSSAERLWLANNRSADARYWNVLTAMTSKDLRYVA